MKEEELSKLELEVLKEIKEKKKNEIREKLSLTHNGINRIYRKFKELGLTQIIGYGGSGCTCSFNESVNRCECGGGTYVGRYTGLTEKGENLLNVK